MRAARALPLVALALAACERGKTPPADSARLDTAALVAVDTVKPAVAADSLAKAAPGATSTKSIAPNATKSGTQTKTKSGATKSSDILGHDSAIVRPPRRLPVDTTAILGRDSAYVPKGGPKRLKVDSVKKP